MSRISTSPLIAAMRFALPGLFLMIGLLPLANASQPNLPPRGNYTSVAAAANGGFWVQRMTPTVVVEFGTLTVDGAPQYDTVNEPGSIAAIPGTDKYWVVTMRGRIFDRGGAPYLCGGYLSSCSGFRSNERHIVAAAASPNGDGLWAVDNEGAVWTAGNVVSYGDVMHDSNQTPTGIAATPSGRGYYIVMNDGGVHGRGDAVLFGSTGGNRPGGHDLVGIALSYDILGQVNGYWLAGSDGGVHSFGAATFLGSTGGGPGRGAVSNIVTQRDGRSYAYVYADGRVEKSREAPPFVIQSVTTGKVIDVPEQSTAPHVQLGQAMANGSASQKWELIEHENTGTFKVVNVHSGLCMDLEHGAPGGRVIQYPCKDDAYPTNQLWVPVKNEFNAIELYTLEQPDYRLSGNPEEHGGGLMVASDNPSGAQGWVLTPAL